MQVFIPYKEPYKVAEILDNKRLWKQVLECNQIIEAALGRSKYWKNHPVTLMYSPFLDWLGLYRDCLDLYRKGMYQDAMKCSEKSLLISPWFLDYIPLLEQHRRRLYTKNPKVYSDFKNLGTSNYNWYIVQRRILIYYSGKIVKEENI